MKKKYSHRFRRLTQIIFISCFLFLASCFCSAQQHKIDSLTKLIKPGVEDTNQARIYLKLANAYSTNDYDKATEELTKAYNLNKKLNNYRGLMNCANMY